MPQESAFLDVVEQIYAATQDGDLWGPSLDAMADLLGAVGVSFEIIDKKTNRPILVELGGRLNMVSSDDYLDYYGRISPRVRRLRDAPVGSIAYDYKILTESDMDADEFYNDFNEPLGLRYFISGHVLCTDSHLGVFAAQRSRTQGHVDQAEIVLMRRLAPHMQQALDLKFRLNDGRQQGRSLLAGLDMLDEAAFVIDGNGVVLHTNSAAVEVLSLGDGIGVADRKLCFADKRAAGHFDTALGGLPMWEGQQIDLARRDFAARRPSFRRPYLVAIRHLPTAGPSPVTTMAAAAIVFVRDPAIHVRLDTDLLRQSYELTAAEIDVASAVDIGLSARELAEQRGVAVSTVRSQLYALMAKLDVNRQTDLIRLLRQYRRPF